MSVCGKRVGWREGGRSGFEPNENKTIVLERFSLLHKPFLESSRNAPFGGEERCVTTLKTAV